MEVKPRYRGECVSWTEATVDHIKASTENALSTGPFGSSIGSQFFENSGVPVIRGSNLANDGRTYLIDDGLIFVSEAKATELRRSAVFQGDLIFTCWGTINQVGLVSDRAAYPRYIISNKQMKLTPDPKKADSAFLFYLFSGSDLQRQIKNQSIGSSVPGFNLGRLRALRFRVPALHEQKAIAEVLCYADALVESLEQLLAKKRQIRKGAMQELLTGKKRLPGFSGEWEATRLGEFVSIRNQKVLPSGIDLDTPCVELDHIGQGDGRLLECSTAQHSISSKYRFFTGDVLFGRLRSYLRKYWHADRDGICSTEIWPLVVDPVQAEREFLFALVQSDRFIAAASISYGTHMPRADWDVMVNFPVRLPKVEEQAAIATVLSDMDAEIATLEAKLSKARRIKQGMMQELLTGRIRLI